MALNYKDRIKYLRTKELISQREMAEKLNINRSTYKEYELQYSIFPIKHLNELCNYFNVSIDYILGLTSKASYQNSNNNINKDLSKKRLKEFRTSNKMNQKELADFLKVDSSTISKYETGVNLIATSFLYMICNKYKISADYLLGKTNNKAL